MKKKKDETEFYEDHTEFNYKKTGRKQTIEQLRKRPAEEIDKKAVEEGLQKVFPKKKKIEKKFRDKGNKKIKNEHYLRFRNTRIITMTMSARKGRRRYQ